MYLMHLFAVVVRRNAKINALVELSNPKYLVLDIDIHTTFTIYIRVYRGGMRLTISKEFAY